MVFSTALQHAFVLSSNSLASKKHVSAMTMMMGEQTFSPIFEHAHEAVDVDMLASSLSDSSFDIAAGVNAWSVEGSTLNAADLASQFFAFSLFPYLALLWFLARPVTKTPPGANFGFQFLLAFVFATIPAGIYAKVQYQDILANIDWLHGGAESLLTITNLLIIMGFRKTRPEPTNADSAGSSVMGDYALPILGALMLANNIPLLGGMMHPEPINALSLPTWAVHSSSLLEWLVAMKLVWEHAETSGNPRWKGMTLGMIPSHTSGICACTYHLFYNSPTISWIVALQAFLTVFGNSTMAFAAFRIWNYERQRESSGEDLVRSEDTADNAPLSESTPEFWTDMALKSIVAAAAVKYGELLFDFPFEPNTAAVGAFVAVPTMANILKWASRSQTKESNEVFS